MTKKETQINIGKLEKLRPTMTVPQLAEHFGIRARKIEQILSKHKIRKYKK